MSCITLPKRWRGSASEAEVRKEVPPTISVQRRTTTKTRGAPQLVDTVREVVQAFELEFSQVRAESVQLKAILDDRRTQLSDLRKHVDKESSENGTLEAQVQHRCVKNEQGDARLAALDSDFNHIVTDDKVITSKMRGVEADMNMFTQENLLAQEKVSFVLKHLDRAQRTLEQKEGALANILSKIDHLDEKIVDGRQAVEDGQSFLRSKLDKALAIKTSGKEIMEELDKLNADIDKLVIDVTAKEAENESRSQEREASKRIAREALMMINEDRIAHSRDLDAREVRLAEIRQEISKKEKELADVRRTTEVTQQSNSAESDDQATKRARVTTLRESRKQAVAAQISELSVDLDSADTEATRAEEAARNASNRIVQANKDFSELMTAVSSAFREYDHAMVTNRELEREVAEAEKTLNSVREAGEIELASCRGTRDALLKANSEEKAATEARLQEASEVEGSLQGVQKSVEDSETALKVQREMISQGERCLQEERAEERQQREEYEKALLETKGLADDAGKDTLEARARLEKAQIELHELSQSMRLWEPPQVVLSESDLRLVREEAISAIQTIRTSENEAHASRVKALEETLVKIREGGTARLRAEKDAAAARLSALRSQINDVTESVAKLRAEAEVTKRREETIALDASRRKEEQCRALADEASSGTSSTSTDHAPKTNTKSSEVQSTSFPRRVPPCTTSGTNIKSPEVQPTTSSRSAPPGTNSGTNTKRSEGQSITNSRAVPPSTTSGLNIKSSEVQPIANTRRVSSGNNSGITASSIDSQRSKGVRLGESAVPRQGDHPTRVYKKGAQTECSNQGISSIRQSSGSVKRSRRSSHSSSQEPPAANQQHQIASESTAEAAGSRKGNSSRGKHSGTVDNNCHGDRLGAKSIKHRRSEKTSHPVAAKVVREQPDSLGGLKDPQAERSRSSKASKRPMRKRSRSPRPRSRSPRLESKEYDLWTDNKLLGDSDFTFF